MSDSLDAISEAMSLNKKLAASLLVRKDALEEDLAQAKAEGRSTEALSEQLALTQQELTLALKEIKTLQQLAETGRSGGVTVSSLMESDPLTPTAEESALQRAREGIAELEAEAGLAPKLAPRPTQAEAEEKARQEFEALRGNPPKTKRTM